MDRIESESDRTPPTVLQASGQPREREKYPGDAEEIGRVSGGTPDERRRRGRHRGRRGAMTCMHVLCVSFLPPSLLQRAFSVSSCFLFRGGEGGEERKTYRRRGLSVYLFFGGGGDVA